MAQTTPRPPSNRTPVRPRTPRPQARAAGTPRPLPATTRTPRGKKRRPSRAGRLLGALLLGLLAGIAMYGGYLYRHSRMLQTYLPVLFQHGLHQPGMAEAFPGKPDLNLLIIGRDADYSDQDQLLKSSNGRSDMLMVAHVDVSHNDVHLLSIPRDTLAHVPGHGITKINAAHQWGGPALTARTVQDNFGISTDQYVSLDFAGFEKAIDLLGGVDVNVDKKMDYDDNWGHLHIHLLPGMQHLNGQQAMGFVRFRHSDSDLVRVQRQQALLAALKAKLRAPQTLARLPQLLDLLDAHLSSDLSTEQKLALARFIHDTGQGHIQMSTLPSRERGTAVVTDRTLADPMIQQIFGMAPPDALADDEQAGRLRRRFRHRRSARLAQMP